ncbi:MAG: restriction endonuclease subunit S [Legionellaceae bacterium]|nr:restriction endonuclease subunit S [Legionellaceae bacterium]
MKVKLNTVASIQMGFSFRGKIVPDSTGNTIVIQMKDLTEDNILSSEDLVSIKLDDIKEQYQIKQNDIVFRSRGHTNTAAFIQDPVENALLAAPLIRIRVTDSNILPAYLCWLINQQEMQIKIQRLAQGTSVKMIEKQELDELDITIPSLKKQKRILELDQLLNREQNLMKKLSERKSQLIKGYMLRIATNSQ